MDGGGWSKIASAFICASELSLYFDEIIRSISIWRIHVDPTNYGLIGCPGVFTKSRTPVEVDTFLFKIGARRCCRSRSVPEQIIQKPFVVLLAVNREHPRCAASDDNLRYNRWGLSGLSYLS